MSRALRTASWAIPLAALLALLAGGLRVVPPREEGFAVTWWPASGESRLEAPGLTWRPPFLARRATYEAGPWETELLFGRSQDEPVASREGLGFRLRVSLRLRPDPEGILRLHRRLGGRYRESAAVAAGIVAEVRRSAGELEYDEILSASPQAREALEESLRTGLAGLGIRLEEVRTLRAWPEVYPEGHVAAGEEGGRILIVGLDGADWKILDPLFEAGALPNIAGVVERGARARLRTIAPVLSPIIWTSIATGKRPEKHGIMDFLAVDSRTGRQVPVTSTMRTARAFWEILSRRGISVGTVGWWATWPAEPVLGFQVTDRVAYQLFGGAGEGEGLRHRTWPDGLMLALAPVVEEAGPRARADVEEILGRAPDPAFEDEQALEQILVSTRIYHHAALELIREYGPRVAAVYYEGTDTVAHHFMRYAPPRLPGVSEADYRRWSPIMERYYRLQDRLLGELLEAAGEGTTVMLVSDHGFKTGAARPQTDPRIGFGAASDWHDKFGIFAISGPGIPRGTRLEDLSVLDITPTLLAILGLPAARDMDGEVVAGALPQGRGAVPETIATYEIAGDEGPYYDPATDPAAALVEEEMIARLTALGYIGQTGPNAANNRGITLLQQGRAAEAEEAFREAAEQDPGFLTARLNIARSLMSQDRLEEALDELESLRARDPNLPDLENLIGNVHMARGDLGGAETTFRAALERDPRNPHLWNSLGIVLAKQGRSEEALGAYREVVAIDGDYAEAINNIGLVHRDEGRLAEAVAEFPGSYNNLGLAYQDMGDPEAALEAYRRGLEADPENPIILNNRGSALLAVSRVEEAREAFQAAVTADEGYAEAHNNLGASLGLLGDLEGEFEEYLKAIELAPDYVDARFNLSLNLKRQGRPREEERSLRQLLRIAPGHARGLFELGSLLAESGRLEESLEYLEQAGASAPDWAAPHAVRAQVLATSGRRLEALAEARAALALDPGQEPLRRLVESLGGATSGSRP